MRAVLLRYLHLKIVRKLSLSSHQTDAKPSLSCHQTVPIDKYRVYAQLQDLWRLVKAIKKMPKIDTLDALEEHEEHNDDYQTNSNW